MLIVWLSNWMDIAVVSPMLDITYIYIFIIILFD